MSSTLAILRSLLLDRDGWLLFVKVASVAQPGKFFRLVDASTPIVADGVVWVPATIRVDWPSESGEGRRGQTSITIPNVSRLPLAAVEVDDELLGQEVRVFFAHRNNLASFADGNAIELSDVCVRVKATEGVLTVECDDADHLLMCPRVLITPENTPGVGGSLAGTIQGGGS